MKVLNLEKMLPADIPAGEQVVWFGRPDAVSLWRRAYRADIIATYFVALAIWGFAGAYADAGLQRASTGALITLGWGAGALAILGLLAYLSARTTLYVATTKRLVLKVGVALPIFHNIPYTQIESAALRAFGDGTGDIAVKLVKRQRIAYLTLWPSTRPFRFSQPEPSFRAVANARDVARLVTKAMIDANGGKAAALKPAPQEASALAAHAAA